MLFLGEKKMIKNVTIYQENTTQYRVVCRVDNDVKYDIVIISLEKALKFSKKFLEKELTK